MYLLDTNTASYLIRGRPARVCERMARADDPVAISAVTEAELRYGAARRSDLGGLKAMVNDYLARTRSIPWDSEAARVYAVLRAELERAGAGLAVLDALIAAHALALGAVLVTSDRAFARVPGLRREDWTA